MQLTKEQINTLSIFVEQYKKWLLTEDGKREFDLHRKHSDFFKSRLSEENIDKINENEFRELYKELWSSRIWSNKDWYIDNRLLKPNDLQKIKEQIKKLLYGEGDISEKFDNLLANISGFGASSISEILNMIFPEKYCLWNDKPKTVLPILKIDLLPEKFFKYTLRDGQDYVKCIEVLGLIKDEISKLGVNKPDFIDLDCFFWYIFLHNDFNVEVKQETSQRSIDTNLVGKISSHEEAEYYLLRLGELLGYLTYTVDSSKSFNETTLGSFAILQDIPDFAGQRDKNSAREIDVIWFDGGENPKFCLEVEHTTDITKGLNRLLQLEHFNVTFVIVASEDKRSKFGIEMSKFPFRKLRDRYKFISYTELLELYEAVLNFRKIKDRLLG